jgi:putative ABC transport system ATP-binding protein
LEELNSERGVALIIVTHDRDVAARAHHTITLRDGLIETDDMAGGAAAGGAACD